MCSPKLKLILIRRAHPGPGRSSPSMWMSQERDLGEVDGDVVQLLFDAWRRQVQDLAGRQAWPRGDSARVPTAGRLRAIAL